MQEREELREALKRNRLTSAWLIAQLKEHGIVTDKTEMSSVLAGTRKGPKVDNIIQTGKSIISDFERESCANTNPELVALVEDSPIAYMLRERVNAYYKDADNRRKFEEWYRAKYGKEYQWSDGKGEASGGYTDYAKRNEAQHYEANAAVVR